MGETLFSDGPASSIGNNLIGSGLNLLSMKGFGFLGHQAARWSGAGAISMAVISQGAVFGAMLASHGLEVGLGRPPDTDGVTTVMNIFKSMVTMGASAHFGQRILGLHPAAFRQEVALRMEQAARPDLPGLLGSRFGNARPLAWEMAQNSTTPRIANEGMDQARQLHSFIVSDDDNSRTGSGLTVTNHNALPGTHLIATRHPSPPNTPGLLEVLQTSFEGFPDATSIFELEPHSPKTDKTRWGQILTVNPSFTNTFGYKPEEAVGRPFLAFLHPEEPRFEALHSMLLRDGALKLDEVHFQHQNGSSIWCNLSSGIRHDGERTLGFAIIQDVSAQRQARLETAEQHGIVVTRFDTTIRNTRHGINNILTALMGYLDLAKLSAQELGQLLDNPNFHTLARETLASLGGYLEIVQEQAERLAQLAQKPRKPMEEGRKGPSVDLHSFLEASILNAILLGGERKPNIESKPNIAPELNIQLIPDPWLVVVPGPEDKLFNVVVSLVGTACDAMVGSPKPSLFVKTAKISLSQERLSKLLEHPPGTRLPTIIPGDFMRLRIRYGSGMASKTLWEIFKPDFSTNPEHNARTAPGGLGLVITRKRVEDIGGFMTVESTLGKETTIDVYLPTVQTAQNIQASLLSAPPPTQEPH